LRGKVAIGLPDVTQNRSDAAEYQAIPEQSSKMADARLPKRQIWHSRAGVLQEAQIQQFTG
jgi:hypothetical protein